jgi:hypothetical protein
MPGGGFWGGPLGCPMCPFEAVHLGRAAIADAVIVTVSFGHQVARIQS